MGSFKDWKHLAKIEFGEPNNSGLKLYGVAFVEGYEKPVGFHIELRAMGFWKLEMEDLYQAKEVYSFFRNLLKNCLRTNLGLSKSFTHLITEIQIAEGKTEEVLDRIEEAMGIEWKDSLKETLTYLKK